MNIKSNQGVQLAGLLLITLLLISIPFTRVSADCTGSVSHDDGNANEYGDGIDGPYIDNGDGTVTDQGTGLMWQQTDDDKTYVWSEACQYCEDLTLGGNTDWELPDIAQLSSVIDTDYYPTVNTNYFKDTNNNVYWSGSTYANTTVGAWLVGFYGGYVFATSKG